MWPTLKYHAVQNAFWNYKGRYAVVPAGRRSGKTEIAIRKLIKAACSFNKATDGYFLCTAPTHSQAKRIFWRTLKKMMPKNAVVRVLEGELAIDLYNGARIQVLGMDKPERVEGFIIDGAILDEYANMRPGIFDLHLGPGLDTVDREGWAYFIGVPDWQGINDYEELFNHACSSDPTWEDWAGFTWYSEDILDPKVIAAAKARMDEKSYNQEYRATFIKKGGRCYYAYDPELHKQKTVYNPYDTIEWCHDFNVEPGTSSVIQAQPDGKDGVIDEFHIGVSNTKIMCNAFLEAYGSHQGLVQLWGDATGGARKTSALEGSDWTIIENILGPVFGDRLISRVPSSNPLEKTRVNTLNARLKTADGKVHLIIDPKCEYLHKDLRMVQCTTDGRIDKRSNPELTHMSDGVGYFTAERYPLQTLQIRTRRGY